ncbi:MAG TPA: SCO family protein [Thermoanaerobaculia bacterium]
MRQRRGAGGGVPASGWLLLAALALATPWPAAAAAAGSGSGPRAGADDFDAAVAVDAQVAAAAAWTEHVRTPPAEPVLPPAAGPVSPAHKYFSDVELVDQDGRTHRFYSDLLQGKIVVVAAFFTSCTTSCPILAERMAALQERVGDRLGRDVYLLSFSVDPQTDTPARLKQYAERVGARPGWFFLTGSKTNVDWALYKLGAYTEPAEAHSNLLILGNEPAGEWKKVFGLAPAEDLLRSLDAVLRERG